MTPDFASPHALPRRSQSGGHVWIRVLVTSDMHGQLLPFVADSPGIPRDTGFTRVATLVRAARKEAATSLLVDNGDFLQGSMLSDLAAEGSSGWTGPNPVITAMNALKYDAASLGNHEFNFGLTRLAEVLAEARFPVVCANAVTTKAACGPACDKTFVPPYVIVPIRARDNHGAGMTVRVGLIGLLPPQITIWDHGNLAGRLHTRGILEAARAHVPRLRAAGAQIVLALAHTGIGNGSADTSAENAALALARVPGVDAIIAGHNHDIFPRPDCLVDPGGVDHAAGTLAGKPAVMAGSRGSHLGVLDLCLAEPDAGGLRVIAHRSDVRTTTPQDRAPPPPDPDMLRLLRPVHANLTRLTRRTLARLPVALHSYTSLLRCDILQRLVLTAQMRALSAALAGTAHADLPVLAATAPFRIGGHAGPHYYTDVGPGVLTPRDVAQFYPFPNTLIGLRVTGHDLKDWLERAVSGFARITPGYGDQPLWNEDFPGHGFDAIAGLSYAIDLSQPPRFDAQGALRDRRATRICDLRHNGSPVKADKTFALAVNSFRAYGGGNFPPPDDTRILFRGTTPMRDVIASDILRHGVSEASLTPSPWAHLAMPDTFVICRTGPGLRAHPEEIEALCATDLGCDEEGFLLLRVPLGPCLSSSPCESVPQDLFEGREVGAGKRLANPVRSGRKQP